MSRSERRRMLDENARRQASASDRYSPWDAAERLMVDERRRVAASMLHRAGAFPDETTPCLEVGFGDGGWLTELLAWGVAETSLHGVEVDPGRTARVHRRLPAVHLTTIDGAALPWSDAAFGLVVASTVFSSVLDPAVQRALATEIVRVLRPNGALIWYDLAIDNPRNPNVQGLDERAIRDLFPGLSGSIRRVTLAPPLARRVAPISMAAAICLSTLPWLRTHRLAVLNKTVVLSKKRAPRSDE